MMTIFTTTYSTLPRLSSKKRMVSLIVFGSHTNRTYGSTHGNYPTTATTTETSSRSIHGNSRLYHNHAHPFRSLSSTAMKTTKVSSSWRSCSSSIRMMTPEPQLALAYNDIDTEDDPENDGDCDDDRVLYSTKHHNFGSNDGHATNSTTGNNNITTTTTATTTANSTTTPGGSTNHGGGGGGGGSRRHRCPKCGTFVTFQHSDFDIANRNSSHNGSSTTFYCAHCSGYFLLQHPSAALLSGTRTAPVESSLLTATTTSINDLSSSSSSSPPPQQRIILRVNHNGGGGGLPPPPSDSSTMPPPPPPLLNTIPTPYEIVQGLNEYVIGQRNVKIALSVGIYNHYKRLFINNQSMMTQAASTPSSVDETPQRPPSSQRPSLSSSSFIIVRHPDRNTTGNQMDPNDLNHDSTIQFTDPNQSPPPNGLPYPSASSNTNHDSTMNETFADYTNHLKQFGTTTNTTKKGNPTTTTTTTCSSSNNSTSNNSTDEDDSINQNNIKYNGRDHSMDDTDDAIEIDKSNILLLGPTGSGKTLLVRTLAKLIQVPLVITDATCLTQAGYVGEDVESILFKLYIESNHDIHKTQRGIIYIDEVDKIRKSGGPNISISRDVSGEGVQHALLKIVEGNVINVPKEPGRKNPRGDFLQIDTTNILFIAGGAFSGLEHIINRRMDAASIGFNANMKKINMDTNIKVQGRYFDQAIPKDLVEYGMIPEFVGRFPVITTTKGLDLNNLVDILTKPKNSIMKQYTKLFHMDDVQFHITDDALLEIAKTAYTRGTGARGLRSITDAVLMDTQYIVPSYHHNNKNIHTVYVDGAAVRKERPIILIHDPHLTVDMYESHLRDGRTYSSISGVIPVSIDEFESTLQQQQGDEEANVGTTAEPTPLEEVAA